MYLEKIKDEKCNICGAIAVSETRDHQHCDGNWNETRKFKCGNSISYSPNFNRVEWANTCESDPVLIKKSEKRLKAKEKLVKYISKIDVDEKFKDRLYNDLSQCYYK